MGQDIARILRIHAVSLYQRARTGVGYLFWRESRNSWKGHVNIFIREEGDLIHCLGGNQGGLVQIVKYKKNRLLGFRRL